MEKKSLQELSNNFCFEIADEDDEITIPNTVAKLSSNNNIVIPFNSQPFTEYIVTLKDEILKQLIGSEDQIFSESFLSQHNPDSIIALE